MHGWGTTLDKSTNLIIIWYGRRGRYPVRPASELSKPMSALKRVGERLRNVSRRCERNAGLLRLTGEGVVETCMQQDKV